MEFEWSNETHVAATVRQASAEVNGEAVILNMEDGVYYGLNEVGARIWELIQEDSCSLGQIVETVVAEYEVDAATCQGDIERLLEDLAKHSLVQVTETQG